MAESSGTEIRRLLRTEYVCKISFRVDRLSAASVVLPWLHHRQPQVQGAMVTAGVALMALL